MLLYMSLNCRGMVPVHCRGGSSFGAQLGVVLYTLMSKLPFTMQDPMILPRQLASDYKVLKAKYYPHGRLEDTVFTRNASSTWQAITYGLELLKKGILWPIGNGRQVCIWRDPWLPRLAFYRPVSLPGRCRLRRVAELVNHQGGWDTQLIQQNFATPDIDVTLKLRTAPCMEDVLAWGPDPRGLFSFRFAYKLDPEEKLCTSMCAPSRAPDGNRAV